jgi:hypothetical protein
MALFFTRWLLALLLFSFPFNAAVPQESEPTAEVWPGFVTTEKYIEFGPNQQSVYASGLIDGMYLAPVFDAPNKDKYLTAMRACLKPMTTTQVAAIITKFAKEHPEKWDMGTNVVAWQALRQACAMR